MTNLLKLIAVAIGAALMACQWAPPHSAALEEARRAFKLASDDPLVMRSAAAELREAQLDLRRAERTWIETHDETLTGHFAYLAFQRVSLAHNIGLQREAEQRLQRARLAGHELLTPEPEREARNETARALPVNLQPAAPAAAPRPQADDAAAATPALVGADTLAPRPATAKAAATARPMAARSSAQAARHAPLQARAPTLRAPRSRPVAAHRAAPKRVLAARATAASTCHVPPPKPEVWYIESQGRPAGFRAPCLEPPGRLTLARR